MQSLVDMSIVKSDSGAAQHIESMVENLPDAMNVQSAPNTAEFSFNPEHHFQDSPGLLSAASGQSLPPLSSVAPISPEYGKSLHARRETHREIERKRRSAINNGIKEIAELLNLQNLSKHDLLRKAAGSIRNLLEREHTLARENMELRLQLEAALKQNE